MTDLGRIEFGPGTPITRDEARGVALNIMHRAEVERLAAAEKEAYHNRCINCDEKDTRIRELEAELAAWREVGKVVEWSQNKWGEQGNCPVCHGGKGVGHFAHCKLAKLLRSE